MCIKSKGSETLLSTEWKGGGLPHNLWEGGGGGGGGAVLMVNFILNRVPHRKTQQTLYEKWKGRMLNLNYLKVWGCLAKVAVPKPKKVKV